MSMKHAERLILPADFKPDDGGAEGVRRRVLTLAQSVAGTGIVIKINSALRACGYSLIKELHDLGVRVMADLKLIDIPETMATDAELIAEYEPELLTVMASAGLEGMRRVKNTLPKTEVLGVTVLTSLSEEDCKRIFAKLCESQVSVLAQMAQQAGLRGLVCSPLELERLKSEVGATMTLNTPGIRPAWSLVPGDDQARVMTPAEAITAGADRIIVGRPILNAKPNDEGRPQSPLEAVERTLDEIVESLPFGAKL